MSVSGSINSRVASRTMQYVLVALQATTVGILSFTVATIAFLEFHSPQVTRYVSVLLQDTVTRPGGIVSAKITYTKMRDCAGIAIVTLDNTFKEAPRIIHTMPLGDRPAETFTVIRQYHIPIDAVIGPSILQETLSYQCDGKSSVVRSPPMLINISGAP